jgi:hypothetical protein
MLLPQLPPIRGLSLLLLHTLAVFLVDAQQNNRPTATTNSLSAAPAPTPSPTSIPTSYATYTSIFATTLTSGQHRPSGAPSSQSVFLTTATITSTFLPPSPSSTVSPSPSTVPSSTNATQPIEPEPKGEEGLPLHTIIDPAFGILGALLIISGLVLAFIGHRSRWLVCLISG